MYAYLSQIQMIQLTQFDEKWEIICRCPLLLSMFSQVDWHQVLSLNKSFHTFNVCLLWLQYPCLYSGAAGTPPDIPLAFQQTGSWSGHSEKWWIKLSSFLAFLYFCSFYQNSSWGLFLVKDFTAKKDVLCPPVGQRTQEIFWAVNLISSAGSPHLK